MSVISQTIGFVDSLERNLENFFQYVLVKTGRTVGLMAAVKKSWIDSLPYEAQQDILAASETQTFSDGETVYERGAKLFGAYTVLEGRLEALRSAYKDDRFVLRMVYPGESIGLVGLFRGDGAVNTIVACGDVTLRYISKAKLLEIGAAHPVIFEKIIEAIGEFVSRALSWIDFSVSASAAEKVLWNLVHLSQFSTPDIKGMIVLKMSQQEFGRMLGLSRQVVNAQLNKLVEQGLVSMAYGEIRVNTNKLERLREQQ